jgi:hypothetical protein
MAQIIIFTGLDSMGFIRYIGPYQIANRLRDHGYSVQVVDFFPYISNLPLDYIRKILDKLVDKDTLWIGFSTTFFRNLKSTKHTLSDESQSDNKVFSDEDEKEILNFVKSRSPRCRFVIGGARAWLKTGGALIDTYIEGYSDDSAVAFTKWCEGKNPFLMVENHGHAISIVNDRKASSFDFVNHKFSWHESDHIFKNEILPIEISRGCIFKCSFCSFPLNGRKKFDYIKDYGVLKDHFIENYERFGTTRYVYTDDTHNDSPRKLEELFEHVYSKLPFKIKFSAYIRLDLLAAHKHTIELLRDSGLENAYFGIESMNYNANKAMGKGMRQQKIVDTLQYIRDTCGDQIRTEGSFILGLPNDSKKSIEEWLLLISGPNFPLHSVRLHALQIRTKQVIDAPWNSDIDKNPEKFGYSMLPNRKWINNENLTFDQAWDLYLKFSKTLHNKLNTFTIYELMNVGCSLEESQKLRYTEENSIRFRPEKFKLFTEYLNNIIQ